jgi:hypothetical protein
MPRRESNRQGLKTPWLRKAQTLRVQPPEGFELFLAGRISFPGGRGAETSRNGSRRQGLETPWLGMTPKLPPAVFILQPPPTDHERQ